MTTDNLPEGEYRIEHDTMGEVRVPVKALYRAQTQRAVENFPISFRPLERAQIRALGLLKSACASVNNDLGLLDDDKARAIEAAAQKIADGEDYAMPATIEDPAVLGEIGTALKGRGLG